MRVPARSVALAVFLAAVAWAQVPPGGGPARVTCGPARVGCGPAAVTPLPTTTTLPPPAPSWISATLAAWMLDEASGTRVNAQGTTALNLAIKDQPVGNDTTNKMQGAAAATFVDATTLLSVSNAALDSLTSGPFSFGCWMRHTVAGAHRSAGHWGATHGYLLGLDAPGYIFYFSDTGGLVMATWAGFTTNVYHHMVGTFSRPAVTLYGDGVSVATATAAGSAGTEVVEFHLGDNQAWPMVGQLDECFVIAKALAATSVCRICSCQLDGSLCTCNGAAYVSSGRNVSACGSCTLPACNTASPP